MRKIYTTSDELNDMAQALDNFLENYYPIDDDGFTSINTETMLGQLETLLTDIEMARKYLDAAEYLTTIYSPTSYLPEDMNTYTDVSRIVRKIGIPASYDDCKKIVEYFNTFMVDGGIADATILGR